jgi:pyruvate dehydrogenase E2 component (dihydrolipoamide acetyltransferase)
MAEIVNMPKLGFDMAEGTLVKWIILEGEQVSKGAVLAEIETDKATVEVESNYEGVIARHLVPEGEIVPVNTPIAVVAAPDEEVDFDVLLEEKAAETEPEELVEEEPVPEPEDEMAEAKEGEQLPGGVKASPLARRMAEDLGINLKTVQGSGPGGRIVKKDIEDYMEAPAVEAKPEAVDEKPAEMKVPLAPITAYELEAQREDKLISMPRLRSLIGRRMTEAKQSVPHFYVTHE